MINDQGASKKEESRSSDNPTSAAQKKRLGGQGSGQNHLISASGRAEHESVLGP